MRISLALLLAGGWLVAACQPAPAADALPDVPDRPAESDAASVLATDSVPATDPARGQATEAVDSSTVCGRFARRIAELASRFPSDHQAFLQALQGEVVGGTGDPFELEQGLREGAWNQEYFYAGSGGFRPEYDDAERYTRGGNHQPGHFVAVLSIAAQFGEENARVAIAHAGDYKAGDEDDLRLSERAIELGTALADSAISPQQLAGMVQGLCL